MSEPIDLRAAAGDYAAGDLDPKEAAEFARLLAEEPRLQQDLTFWRTVGPAFRRPAATTAPPPGFAAGILRRLEWERGRDAPRVLRFPRWLAAAVAAAAAVLIAVGLNHGHSSSNQQVYLEDGGEVVPPAMANAGGSYMPLAAVQRVSFSTGSPTVAQRLSEQADPGGDHAKPWLGVWTRPVDIAINDQLSGQGHLVIRVASDSPAYRAGIRPGDVIRAIDDCPVFSPKCIAHRMSLVKPGDFVVLDFWRPQTGEQFHQRIKLDAVYE